MIDEKAFHAAWESVGWDTQNPQAEAGQRKFIAAYEANRYKHPADSTDGGCQMPKTAIVGYCCVCGSPNRTCQPEKQRTQNRMPSCENCGMEYPYHVNFCIRKPI